MDDNLNVIVTEGAGDTVNDACDLDRIEGNNLKKHAVPLF